ncbi:MAG: hypothetical protein JST68_23565 [Bacteroidetes bacterium]|nr:hypothetical protein [Bacteroidota bacterium]
MIKPILLLTLLTLFRNYQDVRVLTYSVGKADSTGYESLSFWIKSNQRAYIRYTRGQDAEDVELLWAGRDSLDGRRGFRVRGTAPDSMNWTIVPQEYALIVADRRSRNRKEFHWENERAASPDSTCDICAQNEKQAMGWLRKYFIP